MTSHDVKESEMKHNRHFIKFTFAGLLILHPVAVFAAPDMATYDVAGIRIGMTPDQVKPILAAKLGVTSSKIVTVTLPNALTRNQTIAALSGQNQCVRIIINFETKSPINTK
jgi:aconitase A